MTQISTLNLLAATEELEREGFIVMHHPDRDKPWFVGAGSHGGDGKTLRRAMKACRDCCKIGSWWKARHGKGRLMKEVFADIAHKHLGGPKP